MRFELFGCGQPDIRAAEVGLLAARAPTRPAARGGTRGRLGPFRGVRSIPSSAPPRVWPQTPPTARTACRPEGHQRSLVENGAQTYSTSGGTDKNRALGVLDGSLRPAHWKNAKLEVRQRRARDFDVFPRHFALADLTRRAPLNGTQVAVGLGPKFLAEIESSLGATADRAKLRFLSQPRAQTPPVSPA